MEPLHNVLIVLPDSEVTPNRRLGSDTLLLCFDPEFGGPQFGGDEGFKFDPADELVHPPQEDNWYEDLWDASGLDTFPDSGLLFPPTLPWRKVPPLPWWWGEQ